MLGQTDRLEEGTPLELRRQPDPENNPHCRYCMGFLNEDSCDQPAPWDQILIESENFVVVPTLGHFIAGWVLVVPKWHYSCVGEFEAPLLDEFLAIRRQAESVLRQMYGPLIQFEHGPCSLSHGGACVEHAHLHIVPSHTELLCSVASAFPGRVISGFSELSEMYKRKSSYLFYCTREGELWVFEVPQIPSQYMRQLLADSLNIPEKFDWREYTGANELSSFLKLYESFKKTGDSHVDTNGTK